MYSADGQRLRAGGIVTWLLLALLVVFAAPFVLVLLLRPALVCVDGGSRRPDHVLVALVAALADVLAAHTTWALLAGWPKRGEWTISHTLERLCGPVWELHSRQALFIAIACEINQVSPTGRHIKVILVR